MTFRFGLFELDERTRELRRAGEVVRVQPKPFELLRILIRERDRVLSTDELMEALWPDEVVSPASLNRAVTHARRALGDTGRGDLIRSIPRRGYRFGGEVVEVDGPDAGGAEGRAPGGAQGRAPGGPGARDDPRGAARVEPAAPPRSRWFVGRREPLARLAAAQAAVLRGETRIALVSGPPGIGKTRLTEVFARDAERAGLHVVTGRARDGEGFPAFWPWIQVLRDIIEDPGFRAEISRRAASGALAPVVPVLRTFAPEAARDLPDVDRTSPDLSNEEHRFLFFDAVRHTLRDGARARPLVLIFEDLQWSDSGSLRLLEHVAAERVDAPLLLLVTLRDEGHHASRPTMRPPRERGHRVDRTLAVLRQQPHCDSITLGGLSRGEVGDLLRAAIARPAPVDLVSELYARTEGVPLFVSEAIRLLEERGDLARPDRIPPRGITLPARSVEWIARAIDGLGAECSALLGAGAVLGREFPLRAATAMAGLDPAEGLDRADEAIRAGVLEESGERAATYRFSHALFQEAIYAALPGGTRARLHQAAAQRLEQQHAGALEPVLSELAYHHHRAIAVVDPERAFALALQAARQAERLYAWEQAAIHYEQAVTALEHHDAVDPVVRAETLLALGDAHRLSGNRERRAAAFEAAFEIARALGDAHLLARAAIGICDVSEWATDLHESAEAFLREALSRVEAEDRVDRARLTARLAYLAVRDRAVAEPRAREAVDLARRSGDPEALQESLYVLHYAIAGPDDLEERTALVTELADGAGACRNRDAAVIALLDVASDGIIEGRREKALHHRARASELASPHASPSMVWHLRVWDTGLALLEGRFAEAEQSGHDALLLGRRIRHPYAGACFSGQMCILDRELGRDARIVERLDGRLDSPLGATRWSWAVLGRALSAVGESVRARGILDRLGASAFTDIARTIRWSGVMAEIGMLAVELDAAEHAKALLAQLGTARHHHGALPIPIAYTGPFTACTAGLHAVLGLADDACALYEEALASTLALHARPAAARIQLAWARLLARAGRTREARDLLAESGAAASELGMPALAEAVRAARDRAGSQGA